MRDYPVESHSWKLLSPYTACKLVDQTLVETLTTGVPLDIIDFSCMTLFITVAQCPYCVTTPPG